LPERLQLVIQLYFVEELNLAEIAQVLDVSIPRVHQLKAQALEKLRAALGTRPTFSDRLLPCRLP
jgi:RNA polymerase sigma factor for flagellar operon FliA